MYHDLDEPFHGAKPILPVELLCFLCQDVLNDCILIDCHKNESCNPPSACRECVLSWNERYKKIKKINTCTNKIKSEIVLQTKEGEDNPDGNEVTSTAAAAAAAADQDDDVCYCPACGSLCRGLVPDKAVAEIINQLDRSQYRTTSIITDSEMNRDPNTTTTAMGGVEDGIVEGLPETPSYLNQPDAMRAAEYSMTSRDLNLVTSMQRDGIVVIIVNSSSQMKLMQETHYVPLASSKALSERLSTKLEMRIHQNRNDNDHLRQLLESSGGHPRCPVLLPGVGDKLGSTLLQFFSNTTPEDHDNLGRRGHHLLLCLVSNTSISVGGIARVEDVQLAITNYDNQTKINTDLQLVPPETAQSFENEHRQSHLRKSQTYNTSNYGGSLANQLLENNDMNSTYLQSDDQNQINQSETTTSVSWFMKVRFIEKWAPFIMFPLKSQPFNSIVTSGLNNAPPSGRFSPAYAPIIADFGGVSLIPAIVAKLRASEASTAGLTDRPSRDRPSRDRPSRDRPSRDRPSRDRPSRDRPSRDRPQPPDDFSRYSPSTAPVGPIMEDSSLSQRSRSVSWSRDRTAPPLRFDNVPTHGAMPPDESEAPVEKPYRILDFPSEWPRLTDYPEQPYGAQISMKIPPLSENEFEAVKKLQIELKNVLNSTGSEAPKSQQDDE